MVIQPEDSIFALDIGTRSVIGIVAQVEGEKINVLAQSYVEHQSRAVFDGQIHDVLKVAQVVKKVKENLEEKLGYGLTKVSIAAAGRSLKTVSADFEKEIDEEIEIEPVICKALEIEAVNKAHQILKDENSGNEEETFICVGYTVVNCYLNGYSISNLVGHSGKKIAVDVLATFLPNSVVNSLYSVLEKVDLEAVNLTLEPIAAASAIVPDSFRLLNIALLDIGAGTSDIAVTRDGSIVAYGMVPLAGDEITESISQFCLADFHTAEYIKRELCKGNDITFKDIVGNERTMTCQKLLDELDSVLETITDNIVQEIVRLNGNNSPKSVLCVGGGGQVPTFTERIAQKLDLSPERVGLKNRQSIQGLQAADNELSGPEGVTVIGIAKVAIDDVGQNFITVNINEQDYKFFNSNELTVFDALGLIEHNISDLVGRTGKDLRFYLNGERQIIFGELSKPAEININGEQGNIKSLLKDGDKLIIVKAFRGNDAKVLVRDLMVEEEPICYLVNGQQVDADYEILEGDRVVIETKKDNHNGVEEQIPQQQSTGVIKDIKITVNDEEYLLTGKEDYIFIDIFNYIDTEQLKIPAGKIKLLINGKEAGYTDSIEDGDTVEIGDSRS